MGKVIKKYRNVYAFILVLSLIGLSSGYLYYQTQSRDNQSELVNQLNIKETLKVGANNLSKRFSFVLKTFLYSFTLVPQIINIFNIFYLPFEMGFILNLLESYSLKFSLLYISIYHLIPLVLNLILIKIGFMISKSLVEIFLFKDKLSIKSLKVQLRKYVLISCLLFIYEFFLFIFSININGYLVTFIPY